MGYAQVSQKGHGLHLRQYARAFIVDDGIKRVVFVSFDGAMVGHSVKRDVSCSFVLHIWLIPFFVTIHS